MAGLPKPILDLAVPLHGVVSSAELRSIGISDHQIRSLREAQLLISLYRGVYRLASSPETFLGRCRAICLAVPDGVITGRAAGVLWDLRRVGQADVIEVRVPHYTNRISGPGIWIRRCNVMDPIDWVERPDGIRVVSAPRVIFDLANTLSELDLESVIEQVLDRKWCTMATIRDMGVRLVHRSRPGSARFSRVIGRRADWQAPADSHLEVRLFDVLRAAGVEGMVRQHEIELPGGWSIHPDIAIPSLKWAIQVDHVTWHGGREASQRDKQNDRQARQLGWHTDRVTDTDIAERLPNTLAELLAIYARLTKQSVSETGSMTPFRSRTVA